MEWPIFAGSKAGAGEPDRRVSLQAARRLAIAMLVLAALTGPTPSARADSVDDYIRAQMARRRIPGLALAVVQGGPVVKRAAFGLPVGRMFPQEHDSLRLRRWCQLSTAG
jgi:CubicO group peptidase (beta-lactamase class C family)